MIDEKKLIEDIKKEQCTLYEDDSQGDCQEYEPVNGMYAANVMRAIERQPKIGEWIPCKKRLPEEKINPITKDFCEYQVTFKSEDVIDVRTYKFGKGHWWNGPWVMDKHVIAWRQNIEPYHEEKTEAGI